MNLFDEGTDLAKFAPDSAARQKLVSALRSRGFTILRVGEYLVTAEDTIEQFDRAWRLELERHGSEYVSGPRPKDHGALADYTACGLSGVVFPPSFEYCGTRGGTTAGGPGDLKSQLDKILDFVRVQKSPGRTGKGVLVVQLDSGRDDAHPFFAPFVANGTLLPPNSTDAHGHGTRMAAFFKTVAPDATLLTIPTLTEVHRVFDSLEAALALKPSIIFAPIAFLYHDSDQQSHQPHVTAVAQLAQALMLANGHNTLVLFASGNHALSGTGGRPVSASHPGTASVGGVKRKDDGALQASKCTNRFASAMYTQNADSHVAELAGPCGDCHNDAIFTVPEANTGGYMNSWGGSSGASATGAAVGAVLHGAGAAGANLRTTLRLVLPDPLNPHLAQPANWPNWSAAGL